MANKVGKLAIELVAKADKYLSGINRAKKESKAAGAEMEKDLARPSASLEKMAEASNRTADGLRRVRREAAGAGREISAGAGAGRGSAGGGKGPLGAALGGIGGVAGALGLGLGAGTATGLFDRLRAGINAAIDYDSGRKKDKLQQFRALGRQTRLNDTAGKTQFEIQKQTFAEARGHALETLTSETNSALEENTRLSQGTILQNTLVPVLKNAHLAAPLPLRFLQKHINRYFANRVDDVENIRKGYSQEELDKAKSLGVPVTKVRGDRINQDHQDLRKKTLLELDKQEENETQKLAQKNSPSQQQDLLIRNQQQLLEMSRTLKSIDENTRRAVEGNDSLRFGSGG